MHVLQLGPYPPPEGGISRNMLAIREALRERGGRCSIIATSRSSRMEPEPDVYRPSGAYELVRLLSKLDYDILHLHVGGYLTNRVTGLMLACAFRGRGKSVLTFHSGGYAQENAALARPFSKGRLRISFVRPDHRSEPFDDPNVREVWCRTRKTQPDPTVFT
ncbi:MAG: hypothetical protein IPK58_06080 [Acidobacteria bacterium]|nr:hypothetical protein [Acidobacteriota bacterium]